MQRCVLFDFDGTLFDSIPHAYRATCNVFEAAGCTPPVFEDYWHNCHAPFDRFYRSRGVIFSEAEIWERFSEAAQFDTAQFFHDVSPILAHLFVHQCALGIVSGQRTNTIQRACSVADISRFFTVGIWGEVNDKVQKIREVCEKNTIPLASVWYVGDFASDMRDAKAAGVRGVGITRGNNTKKALRTAGADYCVRTLYEFVALLCITGGD